MGSAKKDVRDAIVQALVADGTIATLVQGVHAQRPPQDAVLPYLVADAVSEVPFSTFGVRGKEVRVRVHSWSDGVRNADADNIDGAVDDVLDNATLVVDNWQFISLDFDGSETVPDDLHAHKVSEYIVRVQP